VIDVFLYVIGCLWSYDFNIKRCCADNLIWVIISVNIWYFDMQWCVNLHSLRGWISESYDVPQNKSKHLSLIILSLFPSLPFLQVKYTETFLLTLTVSEFRPCIYCRHVKYESIKLNYANKQAYLPAPYKLQFNKWCHALFRSSRWTLWTWIFPLTIWKAAVKHNKLDCSMVSSSFIYFLITILLNVFHINFLFRDIWNKEMVSAAVFFWILSFVYCTMETQCFISQLSVFLRWQEFGNAPTLWTS